jgi:hypothetical protein
VHSGPAGETGSLLTIERTGQVTVQTIPLGPGSKTMRTQLSCAELVDLPQAMKQEFANFRPSYGREGPPYQGEISIVDRWEGSERRVVWHNPPSPPKPPEGSWAHVLVYFEEIRRPAGEASTQTAENVTENVIVYGRSSSGYVGTYRYSLSINKSGYAVLRGGLGLAAYVPRGQTQLTPEELATLLHTFEDAKFVDFRPCYGQHSVVNEQTTSIFYRWDGKEKGVLWMWPHTDPKAPEGWSRIVTILDQIWARAEKQPPPAVSSTDRAPLTIREALLEITAGKLNPTPLSITYDDMHGLWGGLTLTIRGDGNVEQKAVKEKAGTPTVVSRDSILKLVRHLLQQKAWEQREPQRAPKSDESRARLVIQYGKQRSEIWEWYNDLDKNQRLGKIRELMKTIASK